MNSHTQLDTVYLLMNLVTVIYQYVNLRMAI